MRTLSDQRLLRELEAIEERYPAMRMHSLDAGPPTFEGRLEVDGERYRLRLSLPPGYPGVPPELRELDPDTGREVAARGRGNRLAHNGLCLFPHGNDSQAWHHERLAVDALDRFEAFVHHERTQTGPYRAPIELHIPTDLAIATQLPSGVLQVRQATAGGDLFAAEFRYDADSSLDYRILTDEWHPFLPNEFAVPWVILTTNKPWYAISSSRAQLDETLLELLPEALYRRLRAEQWLLVLKQDQANADVEVKCFNRPPDNLEMLLEVNIRRSTPSELLFRRVDGVVVNRHALADETVVIVGLGSLGGALAIALARAGVRRFVLIDPDRLELENVCRHVGSLRDLGRFKVELVSEMITSINPDAVVEAIPKWLAWDFPWLSAGAELEQRIARGERHIVVSTCAEATAEQQLNALAIEHGTPLVFASVLGSAEHGRIFRVLPGETPCYECVRAAQALDPSRFFFPGGEPEARLPYINPGLPGLGIDIAQVALLAARFTLQTIAAVREVELGLPRERGHHLVWTNRGGWMFDRPLQLVVERFPRAASCPVCGPQAEQKPLDDAARARLDELIAKRRAAIP
jgi:hypothetical protein